MFDLPVYLDNNATTPCDPRVLEVMLPYFNVMFGNAASRSHSFGWTAEAAVDNAREQVARLIGAQPQEIVFTSGATEAVNLAIKGVFETYTAKGNHIITCQTEHKAVLDTCKHLEKKGAAVTYLPVNSEGLPDLAALEAAITPQTILIALMYANNETGVIHPVQAIGAIAKKHGVIYMCDATQAVGKIPVNVHTDQIDLLTISAHKLYGPKGAGALYVRRRDPRVKLTAQQDGGGHERGMRSGTLNVPGIVGLGMACELAQQEMETEAKRLSAMRNRLQDALLQIEHAYVNGSVEHRLPHVMNISFKYVEGNTLLMGFNKTIALSSGSACTAASMEPSYVLKALGIGDDLARASLRFALGRFTTDEQIDYTIRTVTDTVQQLRAQSPLWEMYREGHPVDSASWAHP
ncbi:IscS subfamily cysteine desulfurase [Chitinophaga qingshengii]|uniref:Cysteine desulfurase IscS n=1 Tax=Chitinophaga qingshengii TaxID=1569794 RepID=A0ABR7TKZ9_9BACT|nr:IscS subfamily cysteine desulfurase [Chitinophaga qingshengii]MBC9931172.1 IscS subfamily cysteine desulfurase [Chitinophaga qingshengii]